jgi:hypothetical protein
MGALLLEEFIYSCLHCAVHNYKEDGALQQKNQAHYRGATEWTDYHYLSVTYVTFPAIPTEPARSAPLIFWADSVPADH